MEQVDFQESNASTTEDSMYDDATRAPWKALFSFTTKRDLPYVLPSVALSVVAGCIVPAEAYLYGKIFSAFADFGRDAVTKTTFGDTVDKYCVWLAALGAVSWLLLGGDFAAWTFYGATQTSNVRKRLFGAMLDREVEWFELRDQGVGALLTRLNMHTLDFQTATSNPLGLVVQYVTCSIVSICMALYFSWDLTLVTISIIPVAAVAVWFCSRNVQPNIDKQAAGLAEAAKHATSALSAIDTLKCLNAQDHEFWRYVGLIKRASHFYNRQIYWTSAEGAFLRLASLGMFVQGFWYGSRLVINHKKDAGAVLTTFWATMMATQAIMAIMPMSILLEKGRTAGARLKSISASIEDKPIQLEDHVPLGLRPAFGHVDFQNVSFSYPVQPDRHVLRNVSLQFPAGQLVFLIGKSGSGKSTIGQLLARFYHVQSGHVKLDGKSIDTMSTEWLRKNVLLVEQTSTLFEDTIAANIALGCQDGEQAGGRDIKRAAKFAVLDATIDDMPQRYETMVGNKGHSLSGGQRQRFALARAYLRNPPVIILDEATSALDCFNRTLVMNNIRRWRQNKTTIIITHDYSQILPDDFLYLLKDGEVAHQGTRRSVETALGSPFTTLLADSARRPSASANNGEIPQELMTPPPRTTSTLDNLRYSVPSSNERNQVQAFPVNQNSFDHHVSLRSPRRSLNFQSVLISNPGASSRRGSLYSPHILSPTSLVQPPATCINLGPGGTEKVTGTPASPASSSQVCTPSLQPKPFGNSKNKKRNPSIIPFVSSRARPSGHATNPPGLDPELDEITDIELKNPSEYSSHVGQVGETEIFSLRLILATLWPNIDVVTRMVFFSGLLCLLVYAISTPIFSWVFSKLLATFYKPQKQDDEAKTYSLSILGIAVIDGVALFLYQSQINVVGQKWVNKLRFEAFRRIVMQPRQYFDHPAHQVSRTVECLDSMAEIMQGLVGRFLPAVIIAGTMMSVALIWSFAVCWKLTLVALALLPIMYVITFAYSGVAGKLDEVTQSLAEEISTVFTETFTNVKTVKSLTLEPHFTERFNASNSRYMRAALKRSFVCGLFLGLSECSVVFVTALLFHYGAVLAASREFTVDVILIVFTEMLFGLSNVQAILSLLPQMSTSRDAASRLLKLARLPEKSFEQRGNARVTAVGDIRFNNVYFRYPSRPEQPVLSDLSLSISAGSCVALVGASGSGKSTIASLLLKLYTTGAPMGTAPEITLYGRDINHIHTPTLRNLVTIVPQTPVLFPASVAENIAYGLPKAAEHNTIGSIRAAAEAAGIDEFITGLPNGYETVIGEGGTGVSGGQAQRICIARALIRRPQILVLDEATSALDPESAAVVRETVQRLRCTNTSPGIAEGSPSSTGRRGKQNRGRGRDAVKLTVIIITHAKEMMSIADKVIMLEKGRVAEQGGHDELLEARGPFWRLVTGQQWERDSVAWARRSEILMDMAPGLTPREGRRNDD